MCVYVYVGVRVRLTVSCPVLVYVRRVEGVALHVGRVNEWLRVWPPAVTPPHFLRCLLY